MCAICPDNQRGAYARTLYCLLEISSGEERNNSPNSTKLVVKQFTTVLGQSTRKRCLTGNRSREHARRDQALVATHLIFDAQDYPFCNIDLMDCSPVCNCSYFGAQPRIPNKRSLRCFRKTLAPRPHSIWAHNQHGRDYYRYRLFL